MEKDIEKLKNMITQFIEKYGIKTFKVKTEITCTSKFTADWKIEHISKVNEIDVNLTK